MAAGKTKIIFVDESGKEVPFYTDVLPPEFTGKEGKKYKIIVKEEGKPRVESGEYTVQGQSTPPEPEGCPPGQHKDANGNCVPDEVTPPVECPPGQHKDANGNCVPDEVEPPQPTGDVLYDSHIHSKLHDGNVRTIDKSEGSVTPNGLGIEMHASGNPKVVVNADNTFSLICGSGHGRFYGYVLNYDVVLEIECAFWNEAPGQDLSLKVRSRHNEGGACSNRFGGYGLSLDRSGYDAKREICHNEHDQSQSGKLPTTPKTKEYFKIKFTVKDQGGSVRQTGEMNGQAFMNKVDNSPIPYMVDRASFANQSYYWVRSNIDSGSGEIRIKSLRLLKA